METVPSFEDWARCVPPAITGDPLWRMTAYRLALYMTDLSRADGVRIARDRMARHHLGQLLRSVGSISSNIAEGYGRTLGRDRAHFFEMACGSAREARNWYFVTRHALEPAAVHSRLEAAARIVRMLDAAIPRIRSRTFAALDGQPPTE